MSKTTQETLDDLQNELLGLADLIEVQQNQPTKVNSQRIRKATVEFAKVAKEYRRVSVQNPV